MRFHGEMERLGYARAFIRLLVATGGKAKSQPALRWSAFLPAYKDTLASALADSLATILLPQPFPATSRSRP